MAEQQQKAAAAADDDQQQQQKDHQQWEGEVVARLPSTRAAAAWPHVASFFSLHLYLPGIDVCDRVSGDDGVPGCVRLVASRRPPPPRSEEDDAAGDVESETMTWAKEELVERDDARRRLVYAVVGSNMGFGRYVSTITILDDGEQEEGHDVISPGCRLVWAFECEPVEGWSREGLHGYLDGAAKGMAERIEAAAAAIAVAGEEDGGAAPACS
uniref:Bet v I/Major latex protein domain-containing protein n=1 Tax=Leersia perrieri TaxID=77586 RepID=A0A0D9WDR2_9ORYZ